MHKYLIVYKHMGKIRTRIVEAQTRNDAMGMECGFILSCEQCD